MVHVFPANLALLRAAKEALELTGAFLRAHLVEELPSLRSAQGISRNFAQL
jgi:hypothetical protein